jgi:magnesium transporter
MKTSDSEQTYKPESAGNRMSVNVPTCQPDEHFGKLIQSLPTKNWDSVRNIYVVDAHNSLKGIVDIAKASHDDPNAKAKDIMQPIGATLSPNSDQEKAVFIAVRDDVVAIPVIDASDIFLGAVTAHALIDIMHEEHIEDAMLTAGVRKKDSNALQLTSARAALVFRSRVPWLVFGLSIGMGLGLVSSLFEETLKSSIALAYFIPVVAYVAGSVGAQTSAIAIRAMATMRIHNTTYLLKELVVGLALGTVIGSLGWIGAFLISGSGAIALVVGLALAATCVISTFVASLIPMIFKALGKDPALGSGPLATAVQDVVSILTYFLLAALLL